jgi:invasion protein IalB
MMSNTAVISFSIPADRSRANPITVFAMFAILWATCVPTTSAQAQQRPAPAVTQPQPAAQLPNGASAINESYGDWTVDCRIVEGQKQCVLSQAQGNSQTGQRIYAIELRTPRDGKTEGTILMPFGVKLDSGAILKLDDKDLGQGLRFSTCVPQGCLLPVSFPTVATDAMRKGTKLVVATLNMSSGEAITFNISLNGFNAALDRIAQLGR